MTKNEITMLMDAGFTIAEIAEMESQTPAAESVQTPAAEPAQTPAVEPAQAPAAEPAPDDVSNRDLLAAVTRLTNMMALSNVRNTAINNPVQDVTAQLNSLFAAPATDKK